MWGNWNSTAQRKCREKERKKKGINLSYFFFQRVGKKPRVIFLQLGVCVCWRIFPHSNPRQGSLPCCPFKGREGIALTPTGTRRMAACNSPPGSRNKGITCAAEWRISSLTQNKRLHYFSPDIWSLVLPEAKRADQFGFVLFCFIFIYIYTGELDPVTPGQTRPSLRMTVCFSISLALGFV